MKIIATGDVHGDWVTGGYERHDEAMGALEHVAQVAVDEKADLFVFLGDLTDPDVDGPLAHRTIARSVAVHRKLEEAGIDDVWIVGNHDVIEDGRGSHTLMALRRAGAQVIDVPNTIVVDGVAFLFLPYPSMTAKYDPAKWVAEFARIRNSKRPIAGVFGHMTRIEGFDGGSESGDMRRGREMAFPIEACWREFGRDVLMVNGHYHDQHLDGPVYTPGSPIRCTHGEEQNEPGYFVLTLRGKSIWNVEHRKFKNATKLYTFRGGATASDFIEGAIVRVIPQADTSQSDRQQIRDSFASARHVWFAPAAAGAKAVTRAAERVARRGALKGMSPHGVAMAMVEEAATKDRDRLRAVVSDALDKAGV